METVGNPNKTQKDANQYRMIIIGSFILLVIVGLYFALKNKNNTNQQSMMDVKQQTTPINNMPINTASMQMNLDNNGQKVIVGQPVTVTVKANSAGQEVAGYDLVLGFDPQAATISNIVSQKSEFQISQYPKDSYISITATKSLTANNPVRFDGSSILSFTLTPKKAGVTALSIIETTGRDKTRMMDAQLQPIHPQLEPIQIEVFGN